MLSSSSHNEMRKKADVVIIGGGIAGVCTALWLARDGVSTILCEKGEIGKEQSGRNWGWCWSFGRDPRELELRLMSLDLWRSMNETIGRDTGFRLSGIATLARNEADMTRLLAAFADAQATGQPVDMLIPAECAALTPGATRQWTGGLISRNDGRAEPKLAAPAIAEAAVDSGAEILRHCTVLDIETSGGAISGVQTSQGRIDCKAVVIAAGAWSTKLCRMIGVRMPQLIVNETVFRTAPLSGLPELTLRAGLYAIRKRLDGGYTVGGGGRIRAELTPDSFRFLSDFLPALRAHGHWIRLQPTGHSLNEWRNIFKMHPEFRLLDPAPDAPLTNHVLEALAQDFPAFRDTAVEERWAGSIDVTPDAIPVVSKLAVAGAHLITGFSGHGFGMGPGAGKLMAALVRNDTPPVDPAPMDIVRLADRSKLRVGPL